MFLSFHFIYTKKYIKELLNMKTCLLILILLTIINKQTFSQIYPTFGPEKVVTITGLTFDAMEPFISLDDNTLFFNL